MMAKPMKTLELHYPMIQFLIIFLYFGGFFNKTIIPFALVGYEIGYSQLGPMGLVGYLSSHIQDVTQYSQTKTGEYPRLLKTGSLDNAIREISLA